MWLLYCLGSTIASGFIPIFLRKSSKSDSVSSALIATLSYNFLFLIVGLVTGNYIQTFSFGLVLKFFPIFALHITGAVANILCAKYARVTVTAPIKRVRSIMPLILSFFILNERLSAAQLITSFTLVALTVLSSLIDHRDSGGKLSREEYLGMFFAFIYASFNAISSFLTKLYVVEYNDPIIVSFYVSIMSIIAVFGYAISTKQLHKINFKYIDAKWWFVGFMAGDFITGLLNRLSFVGGPISIIYVLQGSSIVITTVCSKLILKEKITFNKYVIIGLITICGIALSFIS